MINFISKLGYKTQYQNSLIISSFLNEKEKFKNLERQNEFEEKMFWSDVKNKQLVSSRFLIQYKR